MSKIRNALVERLKTEVGNLQGEHQNEIIGKIANVFLAIQAIDFLNQNGDAPEPAKSFWDDPANSLKDLGA